MLIAGSLPPWATPHGGELLQTGHGHSLLYDNAIGDIRVALLDHDCGLRKCLGNCTPNVTVCLRLKKHLWDDIVIVPLPIHPNCNNVFIIWPSDEGLPISMTS